LLFRSGFFVRADIVRADIVRADIVRADGEA